MVTEVTIVKIMQFIFLSPTIDDLLVVIVVDFYNDSYWIVSPCLLLSYNLNKSILK